MTIEIKKPDLEALIHQQLKSGLFHDVDMLLTQALHALHNIPPVQNPPKRLVDVLSSYPFAGSDLTIERQRDYSRALEV